MSTQEWSRVATTAPQARAASPYDYVEIEAAAFASDGRLAIGDEDGKVQLFNTAGGKLVELGSSDPPDQPDSDWETRAVTWTAHDRVLACFALQRISPMAPLNAGRVQSWLVLLNSQTTQFAERKLVGLEGTDGDIRMVSWASAGDIYAMLDSRQVAIRGQLDSRVLATLPRRSDSKSSDLVRCIGLNPSGTRLAAGVTNEQVYVWPVSQGVLGDPTKVALPPAVESPIPYTEDIGRSPCQDLIWSPDGKKLAWSDQIGRVWWWPTQEPTQTVAPDSAVALDHPYFEGKADFGRAFVSVRYLSWSWDSQLLAGIDDLSRVHIWHPEAGRGYITLPERGSGLLWRPAWGATGVLVTPGEAGTVRLWTYHEVQ